VPSVVVVFRFAITPNPIQKFHLPGWSVDYQHVARFLICEMFSWPPEQYDRILPDEGLTLVSKPYR